MDSAHMSKPNAKVRALRWQLLILKALFELKDLPSEEDILQVALETRLYVEHFLPFCTKFPDHHQAKNHGSKIGFRNKDL